MISGLIGALALTARAAKRACALGALGLLLSACAATPTGIDGSPAVALDDRGLIMFDFGPQGLDSLLKEDFGKLTKQQKNVRMATFLLLKRVLVPATHEIGHVAAEKLESGLGWHCARPGIRLPNANADLKVASAHLSGMVNIRNTLPELTALDWFIEMRKYVANRFKRYETAGKKVGDKYLGKGMAWTSWMRATLGDMGEKGKARGLSQKRMLGAAHAWVACHMSHAEMEELRDRIRKTIEESK